MLYFANQDGLEPSFSNVEFACLLYQLSYWLVFDSFHGLKLTNLLGKLMGLGPKPSAIWQLFYLCFAKSISTNGYSL